MAALAAVLLLAIPALGLAGGSTVATQPVFGLVTQVDDHRDGTEPSLRIGPDGTVYVAAPCGLDNTDCKSGWLWTSHDGGATFQWMDPGLPVANLRGAALGSGDSEIALTSGGRLLYADLWAGDVSVSASDDQGATWASTMPVSGPVGADRQWMETDGNDVYVTYQAAQGLFVLPYVAGIYVAKSTDGGVTFAQNAIAIPRDDPTTGWHVGIEGNLVVGPDHAVYFLAPESESTVNVATHAAPYRLVVAKSTDGGATWTTYDVADRQQYPADNFPVLAQDKAGNLYAAWSEAVYDDQGDFTGYATYEAHSADGGLTWSAPLAIVSGQGSAELPWITAGGAGKVAIGYYGTDDPITARDYNESNGADDASYYARVAWSTDALSATPTWAVADTDGVPVAHGDLGRQLFDFVTVRVDAQGKLNFVFARSFDGVPDTSYGAYSSPEFGTVMGALDTVNRASPIGPLVTFNTLWFKPAIFAKQTDGPDFS